MKKILFVLLVIILTMSLATTVYGADKEWKSNKVDSGIVSPAFGYMIGWKTIWHVVEHPGPGQFYSSLANLLIGEGYYTNAELAGLSEWQIKDKAHDAGVTYYVTELTGLTDQVWAVQVEAGPGQSGVLNQNFEAAYGPWAQANTIPHYLGEAEEAEVGWWFADNDGNWIAPGDLLTTIIGGVNIGKDYVGNYFHIDQLASITGGITKRYISISSPWSHALVEEDMTIRGMSEIQEAFTMDNIKPGVAVIPNWWALF